MIPYNGQWKEVQWLLGFVEGGGVKDDLLRNENKDVLDLEEKIAMMEEQKPLRMSVDRKKEGSF